MGKSSIDVVTIDKKTFLEMVGDLPFSDAQVNLLMQKTPDKFIKERPIPGGGKANFIEISYVIGMLNLITGYQWDFDVVDEKEKYGQIVIRGRLTIRTNNGKSDISKTQYGRATIKYPKGVTYTSDKAEPIDYGNDHKAAASDALKKCASLFGIAWDVFGKEDMREVQIIDDDQEARNAKAAEAAAASELSNTPLEVVKMFVDTKLEALAPADRVKFLKDNVNTVTASKLTEKQYRNLYEAMQPKDGVDVEPPEEGEPAK